MATFLVTRPQRDAMATARRLREIGHEAIIAPLMEIVDLPGPALDLSGVQALLATSANGIRALAARQGGPVADLRVLAVGDTTARAAEQLGMYNVESADGDVDDLARLAMDRLAPVGGDLLHVAASKLAGDLAGRLTAAGFRYRREVLYEARAADALPKPARAAVAKGDAAGVLLYSPRSAALFCDLLDGAGLTAARSALAVVCLSPNVEAAVGDGWQKVIVSFEPTEDALMTALGEAFS